MSTTETALSREDEVKHYLDKHNIIPILNDLTSALVFYRPEEPRMFLIEELAKIRDTKSSQIKVPRLLNPSNAKAIFATLDPTGRGYITEIQYEETMLQLGIKDFKPAPHYDNARISEEEFLDQFNTDRHSPMI